MISVVLYIWRFGMKDPWRWNSNRNFTVHACILLSNRTKMLISLNCLFPDLWVYWESQGRILGRCYGQKPYNCSLHWYRRIMLVFQSHITFDTCRKKRSLRMIIIIFVTIQELSTWYQAVFLVSSVCGPHRSTFIETSILCSLGSGIRIRSTSHGSYWLWSCRWPLSQISCKRGSRRCGPCFIRWAIAELYSWRRFIPGVIISSNILYS